MRKEKFKAQDSKLKGRGKGQAPRAEALVADAARVARGKSVGRKYEKKLTPGRRPVLRAIPGARGRSRRVTMRHRSLSSVVACGAAAANRPHGRDEDSTELSHGKCFFP